MTAAVRSLGLALATVALTACGAPYKVIRQGAPSPVKSSQSTLIVFDYSHLVVEGMSIENWMEVKTAKEADYPTTWADLMDRWEQAVLAGFDAEGGGPVALGTFDTPLREGEVRMVVKPRTFNMGKYIVIGATYTAFDTEMSFTNGSEPKDVIVTEASRQASAYQPSVFQHVGPVGDRLGRNAAAYVKKVRGE